MRGWSSLVALIRSCSLLLLQVGMLRAAMPPPPPPMHGPSLPAAALLTGKKSLRA